MERMREDFFVIYLNEDTFNTANEKNVPSADGDIEAADGPKKIAKKNITKAKHFKDKKPAAAADGSDHPVEELEVEKTGGVRDNSYEPFRRGISPTCEENFQKYIADFVESQPVASSNGINVYADDPYIYQPLTDNRHVFLTTCQYRLVQVAIIKFIFISY
jgi:hypothetical protein